MFAIECKGWKKWRSCIGLHDLLRTCAVNRYACMLIAVRPCADAELARIQNASDDEAG